MHGYQITFPGHGILEIVPNKVACVVAIGKLCQIVITQNNVKVEASLVGQHKITTWSIEPKEITVDGGFTTNEVEHNGVSHCVAGGSLKVSNE